MGIKDKIVGMARSKNENTLAFFNILGPVVLNGINFFTVPVFTRLLGTANFGIVSVYLAWVQILTIIIGLQTGSTIAVARTHLDLDQQKAYRSSVLTLSFCSMIFISTLALVFVEQLAAFLDISTIFVGVMILQSFGAYVISFASSTYTFDKQAQKTFLLSIVTAVATVALSLVLTLAAPRYEDRAYARIWGVAIPNAIIGVGLFILFLIRGKTLFSKTYWKFCLPIALPLVFHGLSHIILSQAGKVMLKQYISDEIAGIYSFVITLALLLNIIWAALNNTWVPFYYDDMKKGDTNTIARKTKNYMVLFTTLTVGFILVSPEVAKLFASPDFWSGINTLPILAAGMFMVFLYSFPVNFQLYHKRSIHVAIGTCMAAAVNILLNVLLIPPLGMVGASIAMLISYIMLFIFHQIIAKFVIKRDYHFKAEDYFIPIVIVALSVAAFYLLQNMWYIRFGIGAFLGVFLLKRIIRNKSIF